eukprot:TRINITY_DN6577_c0_g1_i6.p1 TRINITY_DN6577_c0_g1~~TRINITY_DN6577_c0_g1_i6.p1  ORF type:complete len:2033 (+),score=426.48 TRINITY_DN6577_c0_g1_i6:100-6198(+)
MPETKHDSPTSNQEAAASSAACGSRALAKASSDESEPKSLRREGSEDDDVAFAGWLSKRGPTDQFGFLPRYCRLRGPVLSCHRDSVKKTVVVQIKITSQSRVCQFAGRTDLIGESAKYSNCCPFGFALDPDFGAGHTRQIHYFDARSGDQLEHWMSEIQGVIRLLAAGGSEDDTSPTRNCSKDASFGNSRAEVRPDVNGIVNGPAEGRSKLTIDDSAVIVDAVSAAVDGKPSSVRGRAGTGFPREFDEDSSGKIGLRFDGGVDVVDAASSAANGARSIVGRVSTGFMREDASSAGDQGAVHFSSQDVEYLDAASAAVEGPRREVRARVNTGFVKDDRSDVNDGKVLAFKEDNEVLDAASAAVEGPARKIRGRVNTGFAVNNGAHSERKPLAFQEEVEVLDAASEATSGSHSSVRARVNTGFAFDGSPVHDGKKALTFRDDVEEVDAASAAVDGPRREVRGRVNTGFALAADKDGGAAERKPLMFSDDVDVLDAASEAKQGSQSSVRGRVNTGYIRDTAAEKDETRTLAFRDQAEVLDAASHAVDGPRREVRGRVNTGFALENGAKVENEKKALSFRDDVEHVDAASHAVDGPRREVRGRVNTGFAFENGANVENEKKALSFRDDVEHVDAASHAVDGPRREVRGRVNTGFALENGAKVESEKKALSFRDDVEHVDAASHAVDGPRREVRGRVNTGFAFENGAKVENEKKALSFQEDVEHVDAASHGVDGPRREVRGRVNTGFAFDKDSAQAERTPLNFSENVEVLDAASQATGDSHSSVRARVNTGFAFDSSVPKDDQTTLKFRDDVEELDAASAAVEGPRREVRGRVLTGFARESGNATEGRSNALKFADDVEVVGGKSDDEAEGAKEDRTRVNTAVVPKKKCPKLKKSAQLMFNDVVEELEAASAGAVGQKAARGRVNTGYAFAAPEGERSDAVSFKDDVETLDAASASPEGTHQQVRSRVNTGFVHGGGKVDNDDDSSRLTFNEDVDVVDAASQSAPDAHASLRGRVNTGYVHKGDLPASDVRTTFRDDGSPKSAENDDGSAEAKSPKSPVRARICTGFMERVEHFEDSGESEDSSDADTADAGRRYSARSSVSSSTSHGFQRRLSRRASGFDATGSFRSNISTKSSVRSRKSRGSTLSSRISRHYPLGRRNDRNRMYFNFADEGQDDTVLHFIDEEAEIDEDMVMASLKKITFFENFSEDILIILIEALESFEFPDGEYIMRQGDVGGKYFFILTEGMLEVQRDDIRIALSPGASVGESVLLADGVRSASVRAKGAAKAVGLSGAEVREILSLINAGINEDVSLAVDELLENGRWASYFNAYQVKELYLAASVRVFGNGDVIFNEGPYDKDCVFVLSHGSVIIRAGGHDIKRVRRHDVIGQLGLLFNESRVSANVDGHARTIVIPRAVLLAIHGYQSGQTTDFTDVQAKMKVGLLRDYIENSLEIMSGATASHLMSRKSVAGMIDEFSEEQREILANSFNIERIDRGESLSPSKGYGLAVVLHGDVQAIGVRAGAQEIFQGGLGQSGQVVGVDKILRLEDRPSLELKAVGPGPATYVALWKHGKVNEMFQASDLERRIKAIRSAYIFQALGEAQLKVIATAMTVQDYEAGEVIINQGEMTDTFCIIRSGTTTIEINGNFIRSFTSGDYFGERALLLKSPRTATIRASSNCQIWTVDKPTFEEVMPQAALEYLKAKMAFQDCDFTFDDLEVVRELGTGGFGVVREVRAKKSGERFALKRVRKKPIVEMNHHEALVNERNILASLDFPFIIQLAQAFRSDAFIYFLLELAPGADLYDALCKLGVLNHQQAQFYTASLVLILKHLHERRIAYLDLKSENVLLDAGGYCKLADFGLAVRLNRALAYEMKGSPHFMAPEMLRGLGYDTTVDLWSLGICVYEFVCGALPYGATSQNNQEVFKAVLKAPLEFPDHCSHEHTRSFVGALLDRDPRTRLGGGVEGYQAVIEHPFFSGFDWEGLWARRLVTPFVPPERGPAQSAPQSLAKTEQIAEAEELKCGWKDPGEGWDEDFQQV